MYERFYNLRERPFSLTPDPDYLFLSRVHREGLNHLRYGVESHAGFVVITGEIGCGKTTLLQTVLRGLDQLARVERCVDDPRNRRLLIQSPEHRLQQRGLAAADLAGDDDKSRVALHAVPKVVQPFPMDATEKEIVGIGCQGKRALAQVVKAFIHGG